MSAFRVPIEIASLDGYRFEGFEALVDTGATYSWLPRDRLEELEVAPQEKRRFILADGTDVQLDIGWARVRIGGQVQPTIVIFGEPGSEPLLGVFTLEGFGLGVDPVNHRLISVPGLLKRSAWRLVSTLG